MISNLAESLCGSVFLVFGVGSIPNSGVPVSSGRHHDGSHDGGDVEGRPLRHEAIEQHLLTHPLISALLHLVLHWNTSWVVNGIRLVTVIIGLN